MVHRNGTHWQYGSSARVKKSHILVYRQLKEPGVQYHLCTTHSQVSQPPLDPTFICEWIHINAAIRIFSGLKIKQGIQKDENFTIQFNCIRIICYMYSHMTFPVRKLCMMSICYVASQMYRRKVARTSYSIINKGKLSWSAVNLKCYCLQPAGGRIAKICTDRQKHNLRLRPH